MSDMWQEDGVRGDKAPRTYTVGEWPDHAVPAEDAPAGVYYSLALARRLDARCHELGISDRAASGRAGLATNAAGRIIRGEVYPDLASLARLETALQAQLYPVDIYRQVAEETAE